MIPEISLAIQSVKTISQLLGTVKELEHRNELNVAISDILVKLIDANQQVLGLQERNSEGQRKIRELEDRIAEVDSWNAEIEKYQLAEIAPGKYAYSTRPSCFVGDPLHYICVNCAAEKKKVVLQQISESPFHSIFHCNRCKANLKIKLKDYPQPIPVVRGDPNGWMR